jgi:hypothetical protein
MMGFTEIGLMVQESKGRAQSHHYHLTRLFFPCEKKMYAKYGERRTNKIEYAIF